MLTKRIIPCLDVRNGKVVKGVNFEGVRDVADPVEMAQYYYDIEQYGVAEQMLDRFIDSGTSHSYWLARAFILLADVYLKTDRAIEAQEYLLSLKTNYTESAEINQMIDERLKKIQ